MPVLIVESPNKIKSLKKYLPENFDVVASVGHINTIANKGKYNLGIDIDRKYKIQYSLMPEKSSVVQRIMDAVEHTDVVYIASDPDREGEAIAQAIYDRIKDFDKPIHRVRFQEITKKAVNEAISHPTTINTNLVHAQEARAALDKIVGFLASQYLFVTVGEKNLSAGRVQSVVLRLIVEREKEISEFKPETYFTIDVTLDKNQKFIAKYEEKLNDKKKAETIKEFLQNKETSYTVASVEAKQAKVHPAPPFETSSLQQHMAKKFKFPADKTASCCQSLFEGGHITYHRTDSPAISDDALQNLLQWIDTNKLKRPSKAYVYKSKSETAQEAHECIRPTDIFVESAGSTPDEQLVYKTIRQYFIACQLSPAIFDTLKVKIEAKNGKQKQKLSSSGKALKEKGFLEFLKIEDKNEINIPSLSKNDTVSFVSVLLEEKKTKAPSRFSEANLLDTMKKLEIGRPSTTPNIIKKLQERQYSDKNNEIHAPTERGNRIFGFLKDFGFIDYKFTANIEKRLDDIAEGKDTYLAVVDSFFKEFKSQLDSMYAKSNISHCKCGGMFVKRASKTGSFFGCTNYPYCKETKQNQQESRL